MLVFVRSVGRREGKGREESREVGRVTSAAYCSSSVDILDFFLGSFVCLLVDCWFLGSESKVSE